MRTKLQDIAEEANVSIATVSRALNNKGYVNAETKEKIERIAKDIQYTPRNFGHSRKVKSTNIGMIIPDIRNPSFAKMVERIGEIVYKNGYDLIVCDHRQNPEHEVRCITSLRSHDVCGMIVATASNMIQYNAELLNEINKNEFPVILLDRYIRIPGMDCVMLDNYGGTFEAIQTLIDNGHREIAFMCGPTTVSPGIDRLNGYVDALKKNNIPLRENNILYGEFTVTSGYNLMKKFLSERSRPRAIFISSLRMTQGCLQALEEMKVSIPEDLSIIVFGRDTVYDYYPDPISYLSQPLDAVSEECADMILNRLSMGKRYRNIAAKQCIFPLELKLFGSEKKILS